MVNEPQTANPITTFLYALKTGFETTTRHPWLLALPLLIDVLYWLGPRLRIAKLADPGIQWWLNQLEVVPDAAQLVPADFGETLVEVVERTNLVTQLTLPGVGVPALMNALSPLVVPIETTSVSLDTGGALVANYVVLSLLGLILSAAYFSMIATVVRDGEMRWGRFGRNLLPNAFRMFGLLLCFIVIFFLITIPIMIFATIASIIMPPLAFIVVLGGAVLIMWAFVYLGFSVPAMLIEQKSFFASCLHSMRFVQKNLAYALPLWLGILLINQVTNNLWLRADDGSWVTFISLAGHAFIATATVVATFAFYRDHSAIEPTITISEDRELLNTEI